MKLPEEAEVVAALYDSQYASLVRYAWRATGTIESAEEMVQEVFLQLYEALRAGRVIDNPAAWTFIALRNMVSRHMRDYRGNRTELEPGDVLDSWPAPPPPGPAQDASRDLTRLLHLLSRREEEVLLLRLSSLRYEEIAQELGIGAKAVSTLLTRAMQKLRKAMGAPVRKRKSTTDSQDVQTEQTNRTLH